jgi:hypothetical protein
MKRFLSAIEATICIALFIVLNTLSFAIRNIDFDIFLKVCAILALVYLGFKSWAIAKIQEKNDELDVKYGDYLEEHDYYLGGKLKVYTVDRNFFSKPSFIRAMNIKDARERAIEKYGPTSIVNEMDVAKPPK